MSKRSKLTISLILVAAAAFFCMLFALSLALAPGVTAFAAEPEQTYNIHTAEEFVAYARAYAAGDRNPKDVLNISINSGNEITDNTFISIGTAARPFAGTLVIPAAGIDTFRLSNCPLFDYVSTDLRITGAGTVKIIRERASSTPEVGVLTSGAVFANHVVKGTNAASWSVSLLAYSGSGNAATEHTGLIGDVAAEASVTVSFTNATALAVSGENAAGLICGNLGAGASLTVTTAGSGSAFSVTSSGGNAGSLVGTMQDGATLTLASANNTRVNSVSGAGYAGGLVGSAVNPNIVFATGVSSYSLSGSVTGASGAGGIFGYYKTQRTSETFSMEKYVLASGMTISATDYAGGVFGLLRSECAALTFDGEASGSKSFSFVLSGGAGRGGVAGGYSASALTNTFEVTDLNVTINASDGDSAGVIGRVTSSPAYIVIYDVTSTSAGAPAAGLIGDLGGGGSFADVSAVTVSGSFDAGLIGNMPHGVLRIHGVTDLSGYTQKTEASGVIVKDRDRALIYAPGDGEGTGWTFKRNTSNVLDDVRAWGEVLRADGTILAESDLFTLDATAHTVTVKAAVTSIGTITQFALTALNIQLNTGDAVGALRFTSGSANRSATLLGGTITFTDDISLAGTGLTGLTRDDGENAAFTGTLSGGDHTIALAVGETYGLKGNGAALDADTKQGNIHRHTHNGLFAKIGGGAIVQNLTLSGTMRFYENTDSELYAGALAGYASGSLSVSSLTVDLALAYKCRIDAAFSFGGVIGTASGNSLSVTVEDSDIHPTVTDITDAGVSRGKLTKIGGVIGTVAIGNSSSPSQSITIEDSDVALTYTKSTNTTRESVFGGIIASIANSVYVKDRRSVTLSGIDLTVAATGTAAASRFGGLFGTDWLSCDVTVDGVSVTATVSASGATTPFGGLTQRATGRWKILDLSLISASYTLPNNNSSFGFVANKTYAASTISGVRAESMLYLEVDNTSSHYDISALTFTSNPGFSVFDELVATSISEVSGMNIIKNGNAIISVKTTGNVIDTSGNDYNTYLNQTAYGRSTGAVNGNTRYYYNLEYARANTATPKYKFLVWSVGVYAHPSLAAWFDVEASFTGSLDMTGLSYYPINFSGSVTFTGVTIKLDNILTESSVHFAYRYTDDGLQTSTARGTRVNTSQHYLMHTSVFRDVVGTLTVNTATFAGNVPWLSNASCGFLVSGTLGGSDATKAKVNLSTVTLSGLYVSSGNDHFTAASYYPLVINTVGKNTTIEWAGASADSYGSYQTNGYYAGSSLIGNVGDSAARAIYLTFSGLAFDARNTATSIDDFNTAYGTGKSIFSRATILNSFLYFAESSGSYTFEIGDDWTDQNTAPHGVTYGKEITSSAENADKQKKYYGSEYYVHPTAYQSASQYDFSSDFLPYVFVAYNLSEYKHELSINVTFSSVIEGCGKYGDPYVIDDNDKLPILSGIISGADVGNTVQLNLPSDLTSYDYTGTSYTKYLYNFGTSSFTSSNGGSAQTNAAVREYLAGAYFVVTRDVTLPSGYVALGTTSSAEYAFRGVIIGRGNPVITNKSRNPLVYSSNGCVIKDLTVDVDVDYNSSDVIQLAAPLGVDIYDYSGGIQSYGAVISQVLGGDNFIDNVQVTFTGVTFSITSETNNCYPTLTPVGGYVGVVVNGGLIFRNMSSSNVGLTSTTDGRVTNSGYLYFNPIIGRVIAGYAFNETSAYHSTEGATTLKNGEKNYTISDLVVPTSEDDKLNVTYSSSTYNVTIPDGQAMFVLGAIVNSGATSASYNASTVNEYQALTDFWSAYRANTTVRGGATYDAVGTSGFASDSDYTDYAVNDSYTATGAKIPYVIRAYTKKSGDVYLARCLTASGSKSRITISDDCDVAQGFRGIGSIYLNSAYVQLTVYSVSGRVGETQASRTVTLHMNFREYNHKSVSSYIAYAESGNSQTTAGFGLFNRLNMDSPSSTNSVQYITLAGSIFYDVYTIAGAQVTYNFANYLNNGSYDRTETGNITNGDTENATQRRTLLSVGGIAGVANNTFYIKNVTFNNLYVEGAKTAGGLIGFALQSLGGRNVSYITYDSTQVTNAGFVNVVGGLQAGGFIGRIYRMAVDISGVTGGTDVIIREVASKNSSPNETNLKYYANLSTGVGGLVGTCWGADGNNDGFEKPTLSPAAPVAVKRLFMQNINVVKGTQAATIQVRNNSGATMNNYAGGFIGSAHNVWIKLLNCNVEGVNVSANSAGGFVGKVTQKYYLYIQQCSADGSAKTASITASRYAGGAVAWAIGRDTLYFQLLDFTTKDYIVQSTATGAVAAGAGGVVGYAQGDNKGAGDNSNYICEFNNLTVLNCEIKTNYTNSAEGLLGYRCGTGGLIGVIDSDTDGKGTENYRNTNNKYKFSGYNILVKNSSFIHLNGGNTADNTSSTNQRIGDIVGNNAVQSTIKMVGVAVQNENYCGKHVGCYGSTGDTYGSDGTFGTGYIVFANYNAATNGSTLSNVEDSTTSSDNFTGVPAAYPHVTVNPTLTIGGLLLTGDGVASTTGGLPINTILSENSGNSGSYAYASGGYYSGSSGVTNLQAFSAFTGKITMFSSEVSGYIDTDFPVLIVDDTTHANSHRMINSYLRLLTNTVHDFGTDSAGVYSVVIYNVSYANGTFSPRVANASLKRADGEFFITNSAFDSGKTQFSLIDLRFFNPADGASVAYHVYVPVFVKKVLSYSFDIAVQSGTNYLESHYTSSFGEALIENVGTPVTLFFRYTYSRTVAEWTSVINMGEDVHRNYTKTLLCYKANTNEVLKDFPSDAVLVLVDKNRGGKAYYATIATALSGTTLDLSAFRANMSVAGVFSGDAFVPVNLEQMMTLTASQQGGGADRLVKCAEEYATVMVGSQGYRLATDAELADNNIQKYTVTASGAEISERYYLSVFTKSNAVNDALFHYFLITTPSSFSDVEHPSKITDTGAHTMIHLVMGKIFYHSDLTVDSDSLLGSQVMTAENNQLIINLHSELGLSEDLDSEIRSNVRSLIGATEVYQSFLVYLNRKEGIEVLRAVLGEPTASGTYAIDYALNGLVDVATTAYNSGTIRVTQNHVEFVTGNISNKFAVDGNFEINATVTLTYGTTAIPSQFPGRGIGSPDSGVTVSASSNIAFSAQGTTYSKNTIGADETPAVSYYSEADPLVAVLDLNPLSDKVGNFTALGINALNINNATSANFDLLAVIDATAVESYIVGYENVVVSVKLQQKGSDGAYGDLLDVSEYFTVTFENEGAPTDNNTEYTISIDADSPNLDDNGAEITIPVMHFTVKTGSAFEAAGLTYANYRLVVETVLYNSEGEIPATRVSNYVVYTNAKVVPTFVG